MENAVVVIVFPTARTLTEGLCQGNGRKARNSRSAVGKLRCPAVLVQPLEREEIFRSGFSLGLPRAIASALVSGISVSSLSPWSRPSEKPDLLACESTTSTSESSSTGPRCRLNTRASAGRPSATLLKLCATVNLLNSSSVMVKRSSVSGFRPCTFRSPLANPRDGS